MATSPTASTMLYWSLVAPSMYTGFCYTEDLNRDSEDMGRPVRYSAKHGAIGEARPKTSFEDITLKKAPFLASPVASSLFDSPLLGNSWPNNLLSLGDADYKQEGPREDVTLESRVMSVLCSSDSPLPWAFELAYLRLSNHYASYDQGPAGYDSDWSYSSGRSEIYSSTTSYSPRTESDISVEGYSLYDYLPSCDTDLKQELIGSGDFPFDSNWMASRYLSIQESRRMSQKLVKSKL